MQSRKLKTLGVLLISSLTVAGCSTTTAIGVTDVGCSAFPPITWSSRDTAGTVKQVKAHNNAYKAVCSK